jgi:hypothetical protein
METVERRKIEGQNKLNRERAQPDPRAGGGGRGSVCVGTQVGLGLAEARGLPVEQ